MFACSRGCRRGEELVAGCDVALPDVAEARHPFGRARDRALRGVARPGEELLVDVLLARFAQRLERRRVAPALGQAVRAIAERVRARAKAPIGELGVTVEPEGLAHVGADVLAHRELVELVLGDAM